MMNRMVKIFLILNGIVLLGYSIIFLAKPQSLGQLVGFTHHSPSTLVEITAFYGGLEFGLGAFFIWSALTIERYKMALTAFSFIFLAAGLARLGGIAMYGMGDASQPVVSCIEISFALISIILKRKLNNQ